MHLEPALQLVFYKYPRFRSQAVDKQVSVCPDGRRGEVIGTLLFTASGHLRPKCFRVGIKRRGEMLWGCGAGGGVRRSVPCEAGTFERPWEEVPAAPSAEPGRWEVRVVIAEISCWWCQELSWLWVVGVGGRGESKSGSSLN